MSGSPSSTTRVVAKQEPRGRRCTGACCRAFNLQYSPAQVKAWEGDGEDRGTIARMVRFVRVVEPGQFLPMGKRLPHGCQPQYEYSCSNLLANGDCAIYATRPEMCRTFPNGRPCPYPDCEWSDGRAGAHGHRTANRFGPDELRDYELGVLDFIEIDAPAIAGCERVPGALREGEKGVEQLVDAIKQAAPSGAKEEADENRMDDLPVRAASADAGRAGAGGGGAVVAAVDRRVGDHDDVDANHDAADGPRPGLGLAWLPVDLRTPSACVAAIWRIFEHFGWPGMRQPAATPVRPTDQGEASAPS